MEQLRKFLISYLNEEFLAEEAEEIIDNIFVVINASGFRLIETEKLNGWADNLKYCREDTNNIGQEYVITHMFDRVMKEIREAR